MSQMVFRNYGGVFQLRLESAEDLANISANNNGATVTPTGVTDVPVPTCMP